LRASSFAMSESESFHVTHSRFSLMCSGLGERGMTTMPRCTVHRSTTAVGERPTESAISFTTALFSIITELPLPYLQKGHTQIAGGDDAVTRHRELLGPTCRERESLLSAVFAGQASSCIITCTYTHTHTHTHTHTGATTVSESQDHHHPSEAHSPCKHNAEFLGHTLQLG
jgi:hypothetical protein